MKPKERLKTTAKAMGSFIEKQVTGDKGDRATQKLVGLTTVKRILKDWPEVAKKSANETMKQYGPPNEATESRFIWYNNGPWKRTIITREEIPHNFPSPHVDVIEQFIDYKIPLEKADEILRFDGSVVIERTKGEVSARCDMEAANFIAINLMHEIVTGKRTVEDAREEYGEAMSAYLINRPSPYAEGFTFKLPKGNTADVDEAKIAGAMMNQAVEKIKDKTTRKK